MNYNITHTTKYAYSTAVPVCHNLVHLQPRNLPDQSCDDFRLLVHPEPFQVSFGNDFYGNNVSYFSINHAHSGLTVTAKSHVNILPGSPVTPGETSPWNEIVSRLRTDRSAEVLDALQFVFESPYIRPFPGLKDYAKEFFPQGRPILAGVVELTARIHNDFTFNPRATTIHTPIEEVFVKRHGVCQDFAHIQIGMLRSLGLAARYVSGYLRTKPPAGKPRLVGADASHAWLSVYCADAGWVDVDPTNNILPSTDHITVAWGRDYSEVCPIQGVIVGGGEHRMSVSVDVEPEECVQGEPDTVTS